MKKYQNIIKSRRRKYLRQLAVEHQDNKCVYCGSNMSVATLEHIIPVSKGGLDTAENCVASCSSCNNERNTANHYAFIRYKKKCLEGSLR